MSTPSPALPDPVPIAPVNGHVADGAHLVLSWEPVPGAARYRVQVASDPGFGRVVFEQELPDWATVFVVRQALTEDDDLYFWRAQAGDGLGWSVGGRAESFVSGRADQVGRFAYPDETEPFGPIGALFATATADALAEVLPGRGPDHPRAPGEDTDAPEVLMTDAVLLLAALIAVVVVGVFLLTAC